MQICSSNEEFTWRTENKLLPALLGKDQTLIGSSLDALYSNRKKNYRI